MDKITITPDYEAIATGMLKEARHATASLLRHAEAGTLRDVQRILAPLSVAAQSLTSEAMLAQFRDVLAGIVAGLDTKATELEDDEELEPEDED